MKKKTAKQLLKERALAREQKRKELKTKYYEKKKFWEEFGFSRRHPFGTLEKFVESELEAWEREQPVILTGKYQDPKLIVSTYQQKFVEYTCLLYPDVIEELRECVPYFDRLFGEDKSKYFSLFDWDKMQLFDLNVTLDTYITSLITYYPLLQFRPDRYKEFRYDYKSGEYRLLLHLLFLLFVKTGKEQTVVDSFQLMKESLVFNWEYPSLPKDLDKMAVQNYVESESVRILKEFVSERDNFFVSMAKSGLPEFLKDIPGDSEPDIEAFILIQTEVLNWANRHKLEKDWLLIYAYDFIKQFSDNPNLEVSEIKVGIFNYRALATYPFDFKFNGWSAGDERKEDYEKRLREKFETELENYFQGVGRYFNLDRQKLTTKPKDPDFDSVKWLLAWNEGATYPQIAKCFGRAQITIEKGVKLLSENFNLPKISGQKGRKKTLVISNERLNQIKATKIP